MQAIIMAAGKGSRLGHLTDDKPKGFLEIQGVKLIEYNIALLHANGIKDIIIVTGYYNEKYEELVSKIEGVQCVFNPFYEMMNVLGSFYMAQEYLKIEDTIYMHADTLCSPEIFEKMLQSEGDMILPVEYKLCDEEAMKVRTEQGMVVEISKQIPCEQGEGEFIGIAKISGNLIPELKMVSKKLMKEKQFSSYFEGAIQELINKSRYHIQTISTEDYFWGEIDFLDDFQRVSNQISPELVELAKKDKCNE